MTGHNLTRVTAVAVREVLTHPDVRDTQILQHLADGRSNTEIGKTLGLRRDTVAKSVKRLATKVNARTTVHLVAIALRNGWIQ